MQINAYADLEVALYNIQLMEDIVHRIRTQVASAYMKSHTDDEQYDDQSEWNDIRKAEHKIIDQINDLIGYDSPLEKLRGDILHVQAEMVMTYDVFIEASIEED